MALPPYLRNDIVRLSPFGTRPSPAPGAVAPEEEALPSPLPPAGGAGGGHKLDAAEGPPLTPPASGRGIADEPVPTFEPHIDSRETFDSTPEDRQVSPEAWAHSVHAPILKQGIASREGTRTSHASYDLPPPAPDDPLLGFTPAPHTAARRNSITAERQRDFIAELAATGIVTQAARRIGCSLEAIYRLRHKPGAEEFAAAWDVAVDRGVMRLEDGALARAIEGEERMVVSAGQVLGSERRHNEGLVMFFLRSRRRERYPPNGADFAALKPGHPVYERIKTEVLQADWEDEDAILASLDAKIEAMREREEEAMRLLEGPQAPAEPSGS